MEFISKSLWSELKTIFSIKTATTGRPEFDNKTTLEGIFYVLYTGCQWNRIPKEYGCKSTVHGKFMKWCRMGLFKKLMLIAREHYHKHHPESNWHAIDTVLKKAPFANFAGKNPTDRGKNGIKEAILVDRKGAPLFLHVTSANVHDSKLLDPIIQQMPESKDIRIIAADSAFDAKKLYASCKAKNIALVASINPRRKKEAHVFHAPYRWIIEQTFGILSWFRGLKSCWSKTIQTRAALLELACSYRLFKMTRVFG
jgi:putative transposase